VKQPPGSPFRAIDRIRLSFQTGIDRLKMTGTNCMRQSPDLSGPLFAHAYSQFSNRLAWARQQASCHFFALRKMSFDRVVDLSRADLVSCDSDPNG
jgi:hypothetical protein